VVGLERVVKREGGGARYHHRRVCRSCTGEGKRRPIVLTIFSLRKEAYLQRSSSATVEL
jgi:hypothetical protein